MKKLQISLFALLAVIVAVSSAFTAKRATARWFFINTPVAYSTYDDNGVYNSLSTYNTTATTAPLDVCDNANQDLVCAVKITDVNDNSILESSSPNELPTSAPSGSSFIIYKDDGQ